MPAITAHQIAKRENWAQQEVGVVVVFAMVGAIAILLAGIFIHKKVVARKNAKAANYTGA